jgi:RNA polymerase sigma-70 factor (ECF subfamily)
MRDEQLWISMEEISEQDTIWETIYTEQLPRVYNFFRYRVGDKQTAEDLTSTTFEKAWQYREKYRKNLGGFSAWLYAIARNVANDHFRRQRNDVPLDHIQTMPKEDPIDEAVQRQYDLAHLNKLLRGLKPIEHELVALKYGAALTNRQIAKLVGLTETNVGSILHRVVERLRTHWREMQ